MQARRPLISAAVAVAVVLAVSLVAAAGSTAPPRATTTSDPSVAVGRMSATGVTTPGNTLPVVAFSWGGQVSTGGAGTGKPTFQPFTITRELDESSPAFFHLFLAGTHVQTLVLEIFGPGSQLVQARYTLTNVLISSFRHSANGTPDYAMPLDRITVTFKKICMEGFNTSKRGGNPPICYTPPVHA